MANMMNARVHCRKNETGTLNFYLTFRGEEMYLFTTRYFSAPIYQEYCCGRRIAEVFGSNTSNFRQQKLKERIVRMAKYTAIENEFTLFDKQVHKRKSTDNDRYDL